MNAFCAAIDWGTSSFRLWLLSEDGAVLAERRSGEGMIQAGATGFDAVLEEHLVAAGASQELPAIICGMAGARQGWREVGYLDTPADLAEIVRNAIAVENYSRDVRILPGIAQRNASVPDVMRGEETQLLGLMAQGVRSGLICMPGTHSKWVELQNGKVTRFSTYMTGELFAVLSQHSILRATVESSREAAPGDPAFLAAAHAALDAPQEVLNQLFSLRSSQLLGFAESSEGGARLSGMLIGLELAAATARCGRISKVTLVGSDRLADLYESVLEAISIAVERHDAEEAARSGLWAAAQSLWAVEGRRGV